MKKLIFVLMMLVTTFAYAQNDDHLQFDANGRFVGFDIIDDDARFVLEPLNIKGSGRYYLFTNTIRYENGDILITRVIVSEGEDYSRYTGFGSMENIYKMIKDGSYDIGRMTYASYSMIPSYAPQDSLYKTIYSFDKYAVKTILMTAEGNLKQAWLTNIPSKNAPVQKGVHYIIYGQANIGDTTFLDNNDYMIFTTKAVVTGPKSIKDLTRERICQIRKTLNDGVIEAEIDYDNRSKVKIKYNDGSYFKGRIIKEAFLTDPHIYNSYDYDKEATFWFDLTSLSQIQFSYGDLIDKDGNLHVYQDGSEDFFATERRKQAEIKKKEEEIRKQEETKKAIAELNKKYGEKYVNSVVNGEIIVGMPEELFVAAVNNRLIKGVTKTRIDHQSQNSTCYKLFGYKSHDYGSTYEIASDAFIGWVWVNDGKISSIDWL